MTNINMKEIKIWIVNEIFDIDGEHIFASHPFGSEKDAREFIENEKKDVEQCKKDMGNTLFHWTFVEDEEEVNCYEVDHDTETHFLIYTPSDDYSVELEINVHNITIQGRTISAKC